MSSISSTLTYQLNTASQDGVVSTKTVQPNSETAVATKASTSTEKVTLSPEARALWAAESSTNSFNGGGIEPPALGDNGGGVEPPTSNPPEPTDQNAKAFNGGGIEPPKK